MQVITTQLYGIRKSSRLNSYELDEAVADVIDKMHFNNTQL